jgi:hypothetical protein
LALTFVLAALPASAIEFLGVELCEGSIDTRVTMPPGSSLVLESAEIGDNGGLVLLLSAKSGKVMDHVDDLMTGLTGMRGTGDGDALEWSDGRLTGVAQRVAKKYAALAVTSMDQCATDGPAPEAAAVSSDEVPPAAATPDSTSSPDLLPDPVVPAAAAATAATVGAEPAPKPAPEPPSTPEAAPEFQVIGEISHSAADPTWVDVMGVVANHTTEGYKVATFDLSFFSADGALICVDTISVNVLKSGQERAFRDAVRCSGYSHDAVAETRLQFAGGI